MITSHATSDFLDVAAEERLYNQMRDNFWFPVAYSDELTDSPIGFTLFGENLVVVRLAGKARVFEDLCRHRGSALSLGKVVEGNELRCAYHGWTYNAEGRVTRVPAKEELSAAFANVQVPSYPTHEVSGLIYTTLGAPKFPPPEIAELDDPSYQFLHLDVYEWDCSLPRRLENYFDFSHFAWVHDGVLGDSEEPRIHDYDVDRVRGELRFIAGPFVEFTDNVKNNPESATTDKVGIMKQYQVFMPNAMKLNSDAGVTEDYVLWVAIAPVGRKRTRCFTYVGRNYPGEDADFRAFAQTITDQDKPIVESQRPEELPADLSGELHVKGADLGTLEYRRWLLEIANGIIEPAGI